jgi:adenosine kinase
MADQLDRISLSFLADHLEVRHGGVAANICFGLGQLGLHPLLIGAAGTDFAEYRAWLDDHGVDTRAVRVSASLHTARFVCTTDEDQNQIATFYAGAMAEAREIDLAEVLEHTGRPALVLVGADDPAAMLRHTVAARRLGVRVAADPSQQLPRLDREEARGLVNGVHVLLTNAYEAALLMERTGWTERQVLDRVGTWVVTHGANGVRMRRADGTALRVPAVPVAQVSDPTGAGDAFRAGFLAGLAHDWPYRRAAQLGCAVAATAVESSGPQTYKLLPSEVLDRIARGYGRAVGRAIAPMLKEAE